jgi:SAM-dependent methyltransferase
MTTSDAAVLSRVVDTDAYPLTEPDTDTWKAVVAGIQRDLDGDGCSVLNNFIRPSLFEELRAQGEAAAPNAHYAIETVNVYNIDINSPLPDRHPGRVRMQRGNAFVARDQIEPDAIVSQLYRNHLFRHFIAACFGLPELYELADPLSALVLNVIRPGLEHPWHFDTNEFTVSLLTQEPDDGGIFEYCPRIRSAADENLDDVAAVLAGEGEHLVHRLTLRPGDLQLFQGRYALHRVSEVGAGIARHTAIFAYTQRPGVIGSVARTQQLFGRVLPEHLAAEKRVRGDSAGKVSLDHIYTQPDPRGYFGTLRALDYCIPELAKPYFVGLIDELRAASVSGGVTVVDVGCGYGVNAALLRCDCSMEVLYEHYRCVDAGASRDALVATDRELLRSRGHQDRTTFVGLDVCAGALAYACEVGFIDVAVRADLERDDPTDDQRKQLGTADLVISTGCLGYVTERTLTRIAMAGARLPLMAHTVLRMYSYEPAVRALTALGYQTVAVDGLFRQRRFASTDEQTLVLDTLADVGVDPTGLETEGWMYAQLFISRPC